MAIAYRAQLRRIMQEAWSWLRQVGGTFAAALRTAWRAHKVRSRPRVELQTVKPGARNLSPLRQTSFLSQRYQRRFSGCRQAPASAASSWQVRP